MDDSTTEEKLDVNSEHFDPLEALYNPNFAIPCRGAPLMDNVEAFVSRYERGGLPREPVAAPPQPPPPPERQQQLSRQFTAEQVASSSSTRTNRKRSANVLTYMEKQLQRGGPMGEMSKCVERRGRVKVFVRGIDRMRGHCSGFLVAFDKHWNLALTDVEEVYERKRFPKSPPIADEALRRTLEGKNLAVAAVRSEEIGYSTVLVLRRHKKHEVCKRHVPQVVLRGEHVASVVLL